MKRFLIIGSVLVAILIVVVIMTKGSGKGTLKVATEKAARRDITEIVSASGKVQSENQVVVGSDVSGEIVELLVKEGDTVKKGDLLLRINPIIYQSTVEQMEASLNGSRASLANTTARLAQSQANFNNAEAAFNRSKKLHDNGAISDAEFEQSKASFESAKADVNAATESVKGAQFNVSNAQAAYQQAQDNLAKTNIYAPVSGTVAQLNKKKGERVLGTQQFQGTDILTLANLNEMEVQVDVNENDILRVHVGDTSMIEVDAHSNRKFRGIVTEVANSATTTGLTTDQVTNFPVKVRILRESYADLVDLKHPERYVFLPGMTATVEIQTKSVRQVITVPIQSVTTRTDTASKEEKKADKPKAGGPGDENKIVVSDTKEKQKEEKKAITCVFVYHDGVVKLVPVVAGIEDNMYIQIISGLQEGDEVVSSPYKAISSELYNNSKVQKVSKEELMSTEE